MCCFIAKLVKFNKLFLVLKQPISFLVANRKFVIYVQKYNIQVHTSNWPNLQYSQSFNLFVCCCCVQFGVNAILKVKIKAVYLTKFIREEV